MGKLLHLCHQKHLNIIREWRSNYSALTMNLAHMAECLGVYLFSLLFLLSTGIFIKQDSCSSGGRAGWPMIQHSAVQIPASPSHMLKCCWARHCNPPPSWKIIGRVSMYEWMDHCKVLWICNCLAEHSKNAIHYYLCAQQQLSI